MSTGGDVAAAIVRAAAMRADAGLGVETTAYRLFHDHWDGVAGLRIDRLGDTALVRVRDEALATTTHALDISTGVRLLGLKHAACRFDPPAKVTASLDHNPVAAVVSALEHAGLSEPPSAPTGLERGLRYELSTRAGFSCGLFFDMRAARSDLAERWRGLRILNLFAYTCAFGVCLGAANHVVNVDLSAPTLAWGQRNYALNGLEIPTGAFVREDAFAFLRRAARKGDRYDAVVLDPPPYSAGKRGKASRFSLRSDLQALVAEAAAIVAPGGEMFVSTNLESLGRDAFDRAVRPAGVPLRRWGPGPDYPVPTERWPLNAALLTRG